MNNRLETDMQMRNWTVLVIFVAIISEIMLFSIRGAAYAGTTFLSSFTSVIGVTLFIGAYAGLSSFTFWIGKKYSLSMRAACACLGAGLVLLFSYYHFYPGQMRAQHFNLIVIFAPFGAVALVRLFIGVATAKYRKQRVPQWIYELSWFSLFVLLVGETTSNMLRIGDVIFPATFDYYIFHMDAAYGGLATSLAKWSDTAWPVWQTAVESVYNLINIVQLLVLGVLMRESKMKPLNVWRIMVIPYGVAWLCYSWLPATGPIYAFYKYPFPYDLPALDHIPAAFSIVVPAARNAMPSMHLSATLLFVMLSASLQNKLIFAALCVFAGMTACATLTTGEHYFLDLIVALPFVMWLGVLLISPPLWAQRTKIQQVVFHLCGGTFFIWMGLMRLATEWLYTHLWFVELFSIWSILIALALFIIYVRMVWREKDVLVHQETVTPSALAAQTAWGFRLLLPQELRAAGGWLVGIFFLSGFAGLVYEVVYAKALGVTFGGTALASNTVLATYMGGMALGAWMGGLLAERSTRPLWLYAICEAAIGFYALLTPSFFHWVQNAYVVIALNEPPDSSWLTALRVTLGMAVLGVPTVLMGATLPLVFKKLKQMGLASERAIAPLYSANVLGAAAGALAGGYVLLPILGRNSATYMAALISLLVALYVIDKLKAQPALEDASNLAVQPEIATTEVQTSNISRQLGWASVAVLMIGGAVTLALEVLNMHMLAVVAGNSVYAFGLMLATFLLGLGAGSAIGEYLLHRIERATVVIWAQSGLAVTILLTSFVWYGLADYLGSFGLLYQYYHVHIGFAGREVIRGIVCAIAMMPPAFFIGISYPGAMGIAADWLGKSKATKGLGIASGLNTLGNITGVILVAFWLLPYYGSHAVYLGLIGVAIFLALLMWLASAKSRQPMTKKNYWYHWEWNQLAPIGLAVLLLPFFPINWDYTALSQGSNVYFRFQNWGRVIDSAESVEGGLTTVAAQEVPNGQDSLLTLLTNGKFQGNNAKGGEMVAQASFALIPLLHTEQRDNTLVIGYGTGMSAHVLYEEGYRHIEVAELSKDIVDMADKHFFSINGLVSKKPSVLMHYTDGRNFLLTQDRQYDLISMEISSIWFAGAANLYNKEFYALARKRLKNQGILQQWVQLHHMRPMDLLYILGSVRSEFKYVWVYFSGGQGIIVASNSPTTLNNSEAKAKLGAYPADYKASVQTLEESLLLSPSGVDRIMKKFDPELKWLQSTDVNLYLEYSTPKGNSLIEFSAENNAKLLQKLATQP